MIIKPRVRGFICVTTHPAGCEANVKQQIDYVEAKGPVVNGPKKVWSSVPPPAMAWLPASPPRSVPAPIPSGCSSSVRAARASRAPPAQYNSAAFEKFAHEKGLYARSINGDAFSDEVKRLTIGTIKRDLGKVDLVVYSTRRAAPYPSEERRSVLLDPQADRQVGQQSVAWTPTRK